MARTITEIKTSITSTFTSNVNVINWYALDQNLSFDQQFSLVSFENILFDIMAFIVWTLESIFDVHKQEVTELINEQKVPSLRWYRNQALRFQYGFDLLEESDQFYPNFDDGTGTITTASPDQILASKIIKYAAVTKVSGASKISMKIAPENGDDVFDNNQMTAFAKYIEEIQATGDNIVIVNYLPDILKLNFKIKYNPQVLLANGQSILNANFPVQEAIKLFLKNLPFDGKLSVQKLEAAILSVDGVNDLGETFIQTKWIEPGVGYGFLQPINIDAIPKSGRFTLIDDVTGQEDWSGIQYIA